MDGSLPGRGSAVTDQQDLVSCPSAPHEGFHECWSIHAGQFRRQDPGGVQGVVGVYKYLHGLPIDPREAGGGFFG